jgi:hypothetical protein
MFCDNKLAVFCPYRRNWDFSVFCRSRSIAFNGCEAGAAAEKTGETANYFAAEKLPAMKN